MPAPNMEADGSSRDEKLQRAISLLETALALLDELGDHPEAGARLSGIIEALKDDGDLQVEV